MAKMIIVNIATVPTIGINIPTIGIRMPALFIASSLLGSLPHAIGRTGGP
jgi:hypothetical protein